MWQPARPRDSVNAATTAAAAATRPSRACWRYCMLFLNYYFFATARVIAERGNQQKSKTIVSWTRERVLHSASRRNSSTCHRVRLITLSIINYRVVVYTEFLFFFLFRFISATTTSSTSFRLYFDDIRRARNVLPAFCSRNARLVRRSHCRRRVARITPFVIVANSVDDIRPAFRPNKVRFWRLTV